MLPVPTTNQIALETAAVAGTTHNYSAADFGGLNPSLVTKFLKCSADGGIFTDLVKYVPKTYPKDFFKFEPNKARNVLLIFNALTEEQKSVLKAATEKTADPIGTSEAFTKSDRCRLIELRWNWERFWRLTSSQ